MNEKLSGNYISEIKFNTGKIISINKNDIVVFVGPNNAGKSQSLSDIYNLSYNKTNSIVISNITIQKNFDEIQSILQNISPSRKDNNYTYYNVMGNNFSIYDQTNNIFSNNYGYGDFRNLIIANLNTTNRLSICYPAHNIIRSESKVNPIHYAAFNKKYRDWISINFKKAFGEGIIPDINFGNQIPLRIGSPINLGDNQKFRDELERQDKFIEIINNYEQVHEQGDGIKSFTGILLYLMLDYFKIYLIDEPESFLHPPQARIIGQIIGETLSNNQQAFLSTHSEEIIKGLLDTCPERLKIIRITREGNKNEFSILDNTKIGNITNDALLKYSNILSAMFYKSVVLCESDSDCKMYSIIENYEKQIKGKFAETLFIHCGGKHRMSKVISALKDLNINITVIPDMDIMNDKNTFINITTACGISWENIEKDYNIIVSNLHSQKENIDRKNFKDIVNRILDEKNTKNLSNTEIENIQKELKISSKWNNIKLYGEQGIPAGDGITAFENMNKTLKENKIFMVPVGEIENFIRDVGNHGPEWVNRVLEKHPNLGDCVYNDIKNFINEMNL